jgi:27-O-demethylrifamycin SV methyltransferase
LTLPSASVTTISVTSTAPDEHYNRVIPAWGMLLGENLHVGVFDDGSEDLGAATEALTRRMADRGEVMRDATLLDVGCGTGAPAVRLAREYGCRVTGISTSEVGVRAAQARADAEGFAASARFLVADGMAMPFADGSFDRVWALESSHLMPDKDKLLAECRRVLKPSGILVLCDVIRRSEVTKADTMPLLILRHALGDAKMETLDFYRERAEAVGFVDVKLEDISDLTRPTFSRWRANAEASRDRVVGLVGSESWDTFMTACDVLERMWDERKLGYGLVRATKA